MPTVDTFFVPDQVAPEALRGKTVVVVDLLRATTSMIWAMAAGVEQIIPVASVEEARDWRQSHPDTALAGERHCLPIEGFDVGNAPRSFQQANLRGRTVVMTTTNGTRAILHCRQAQRVLIGALANLSATAEAVAGEPIFVMCAGTGGKPTQEDTLFAGALIDRVRELLPDAAHAYSLSANAAEALRLWQNGPNISQTELIQVLESSRGGQNLLRIGRQDDIADAAAIDICPLVVEFNVEERTIRRQI